MGMKEGDENEKEKGDALDLLPAHHWNRNPHDLSIGMDVFRVI